VATVPEAPRLFYIELIFGVRDDYTTHSIFVPSLFVRADFCAEFVRQSRSEPESKQKTETQLTFWYILPYFVHSEPLQSKQKQKQVCASHNLKCDHLWHLWPKCDQTCFAKKTAKKTEKRIRSQSQICDSLQVCDRHKCHKLVTHSVWLVQTCFCFCLEFRFRTAFIFWQLIVLVASWPIVEFVIIQRLVDSEIRPWYFMFR